ncbi:MAG: DNA repair photolyase [Candidatus Pseudothioglobus sp.]|jgi:DNA repair photolyase
MLRMQGTPDQPNQRSMKGRGALSNPANRFEPLQTEPVDDGWWQDAIPKTIRTELLKEQVRTIISTNQSPDIPFEQSINPYRGCEHGCIYCYARPSHAYWDMSPGLDFETKIVTKPDAALRLREQLSRPSYVCKPIVIGANTDPYQPAEALVQTTRQLLSVLQEFSHPFSIITKSAMVLRDLDILAPMAEKQLCSVAVSITTLDNEIKRRLEPRTASPAARLRVVEQLSSAGIPVTVMVAPVIPRITDHELEAILSASKSAGAHTANYIFLRLPREVAPMFRDWLVEHYPDRAAHVMNIVQQSHGGKDYRSEFGKRMTGEGVFADLIKQRFRLAVKKLDLLHAESSRLDCGQFHRANEQLSLF